MATQTKSESQIAQIIDSIKDFINYQFQYLDNACFRIQVNKQYKNILTAKEKDAQSSDSFFTPFTTTKQEYATKLNNFDVNKVYIPAAYSVYTEDLPLSQSNLQECLRQNLAKTQNTVPAQQSPKETTVTPNYDYQSSPFDRRLDRESISSNNQATLKTPMSTRFAEPATVGFLVSEKTIRNNASQTNMQKLVEQRDAQQQELIKNNYYIGVPALINPYALIKLYGSEGGQKLVNKKNERRWYEVDSQIGDNNNQLLNYSSVPTTSSIISWGNGDPYGRTPYHFTDFVFCKYWNKIANNRMITLRRFPAPILDNMKFPGMDGTVSKGSPTSNDVSANTTKGDQNSFDDGGSGSKIMFPPMATAVTYFGEETGNTLNSLLKFTTGYKWTDVQAAVWNVTSESTPDSAAGPGKLYGGLTKIANMLNIASGNWGGSELVANAGNMPPDPYENGPYENRIRGPVNRIDSVKKRDPGLEFKMDGLNLIFEYVARPVGGVNPKAVLLDIMSNFFIIGSASAVFFGGQHRFMANPAKYPFLGGDKGIEKWYRGDPIGWSRDSLKSFTQSAQVGGTGLWESAKAFFSSLFGGGGGGGIFGSVEGLFTGASGQLIKNELASKTAGQVPYLSGLRALLIGEPVGEFFVCIGNPLNPIAMIGNLICTSMDIEFNDELGPDDFPTEMKITVHLDHGMARDRDSIESIFNRGMGRIYSISDSMIGSSDQQTKVDTATKNAVSTGTMPGGRTGFISTSGTTGRSLDKSATIQNKMQGNISVWNRNPFYTAVSQNVNETDAQSEDIFRSQYRIVDWVGQRALQ